MTASAHTGPWKFTRRMILLLLLVALIALIVFLTGPKFGAIYKALSPPVMRVPDTLAAPEPLEQGWSEALSQKFHSITCLLYTSPSPRDGLLSRMPSSA